MVYFETVSRLYNPFRPSPSCTFAWSRPPSQHLSISLPRIAANLTVFPIGYILAEYLLDFFPRIFHQNGLRYYLRQPCFSPLPRAMFLSLLPLALFSVMLAPSTFLPFFDQQLFPLFFLPVILVIHAPGEELPRRRYILAPVVLPFF